MHMWPTYFVLPAHETTLLLLLHYCLRLKLRSLPLGVSLVVVPVNDQGGCASSRVANVRPMNLATPMLYPLLGGAVDPSSVAGPNADADIGEVLPQPIESLALINGEVAVARGISGLSQGLRPRCKECFGLIDVGGDGVGLRLNLSDRPVVAGLKEIEAKPVDLTLQFPELWVEPLTHLPFRGDISVRHVLAVGVVRERELRRPTGWVHGDKR